MDEDLRLLWRLLAHAHVVLVARVRTVWDVLLEKTPQEELEAMFPNMASTGIPSFGAVVPVMPLSSLAAFYTSVCAVYDSNLAEIDLRVPIMALVTPNADRAGAVSMISRTLMSQLGAKRSHMEAISRLGPVGAKVIDRHAIEAMAQLFKQTANEAFRGGDYAGAHWMYTNGLALLRHETATVPFESDLVCNLSITALKLGHNNEALKAAERAVEIAPNLPRSHQRVGQALMAHKRYNEAVAAFERAVACATSNSEHASLVAGLQRALADARKHVPAHSTLATDDAMGDPFRAIGHEHNNPITPMGTISSTPVLMWPSLESEPFVTWFTNTFVAMRDKKDADPEILDILDGYRYTALGVMTYKEEAPDTDMALKNLTVAANEYHNADAMVNLALIFISFFRPPRLAEAEEQLRRATETPIPEKLMSIPGCERAFLTRGAGTAWANLGTLCAWNGRHEEARSCFEQGIQLYDNCYAYYNMAMFVIYGRAGLTTDYGLAREYLLKSAKRGCEAALYELGGLCLREKDLHGAMKWYKAAADKGAMGADDQVHAVRTYLHMQQQRQQQQSRHSSPLSAASPSPSPATVSPKEFAELLVQLKGLTVRTQKNDRALDQWDAAAVLAQLKSANPRTPFIKALIDARLAIEQALRGFNVAQKPDAMIAALCKISAALRWPDCDMVFHPHELRGPLLALDLIWQTHPIADLAVLRMHAAARHAFAIPWTTDLLTMFPDDHTLCQNVSSMISFSPDTEPATLDRARTLLELSITNAPSWPTSPNPYILVRTYQLARLLCMFQGRYTQRAKDLLEKTIAEATPYGHRFAGSAHFGLAVLYYQGYEDISHMPLEIRHKIIDLYNRGIAFVSSVPEFVRAHLPVGGIEERLQEYVTRLRELEQKEMNKGPVRTPPVLPTAIYGGNVIPAPEGISITHRVGSTQQLTETRNEMVPHLAMVGSGTRINVPQPRKTDPPISRWSGSEADDRKLRPIMAAEIFPQRKDVVFNGRVLTVVVVSHLLVLTSATVAVEDAQRDVLRVSVLNMAADQLRTLVPGRILRIRNPYARIAVDGKLAIRIDYPEETLVAQPQIVKMCWNCVKTSSGGRGLNFKLCGRCSIARYCSAECQRIDWAQNGHKHACAHLVK